MASVSLLGLLTQEPTGGTARKRPVEEARLRGRKTDSEETIQLRLANSIKELEYEKKYDITIINYTVEQACDELKKIIEEKSK